MEVLERLRVLKGPAVVCTPCLRNRAPLIKNTVLAALALAFTFGVGQVAAERWWIQPSASLVLGYDDNPRLTTVDAEGDFETRLRAAMRASRSSESSDATFVLGVARNSFADLADLDNNSGYAGIQLDYRLERHQFALDGRFDSQSTLTSEEATTGLVQVNRQRNLWSISPSWTYLATDRTTLSFAASYQDVSYEDSDLLPLGNYQTGSLGLGVGYRLTERFQLNTRLNYNRYERSGPTNEYDNVALLLGGEYQISEISGLEALIGYRQTEQTIEGSDDIILTNESSGPTYLVRYFRGFDRGGGFNIEAMREVTPSGGARVLDTTGVTVGLSYPLNSRWGLSISGAAYRNRAADSDLSGDDRDFLNLYPRISYDLAETWRLSLAYRLRWQDRELIPGDATSNAIFLTLNWTRPWDL